jgi:hypothetical protein
VSTIKLKETKIFKVKDCCLLVELLQEGNELKGVSLRYDSKEDPICSPDVPVDSSCILGNWKLTKKAGSNSALTGVWEGPFTYLDEAKGKVLQITWIVNLKKNGSFEILETSRKNQTGGEEVRKVPSNKPDVLNGTVEEALIGNDVSNEVVILRNGNSMTGSLFRYNPVNMDKTSLLAIIDLKKK